MNREKPMPKSKEKRKPWPIKILKLKTLRPAPYNTRAITQEAMAALEHSLERFGIVEPLILNERTGFLIGGHQRLEALKEEGVEEAPVVVVSLDEDDAKALSLTLNNRGAQGYYTKDVEPLLDELKALMPDIYDELRLFSISDQASKVANGDEEETGEEPLYDLSPQPYESYHYVVMIFRNDIDWTAGQEHFQLKAVADPSPRKKGKGRIGLGLVVDGADYLKRVGKR